MTVKFTDADRRFLESIGIDAALTLDDERLELARRIAKHVAPAQVKVSPNAARLALIRRALELLAREGD